ncbi:MAG TPA: hypothetical protein VLH56_18170 [Dissulfurispiraceae bacterium]|nr:hypothetical protein [Dissulfurispiraceae bacterium]
MAEQNIRSEKPLRRAISVSDLENFSPHLLPFTGAWYDLMGMPELKGTWLIWGDSGSGKTRFSLQLAKYLANWRRVAYNSVEEGLSESLRIAFQECGMSEMRRRIVLLDQEPINELIERIKAPKAPKVWFIDSLQYTGMNYLEYKAFRELFNSGRQLILVSHANGRLPEGRTANRIRFDAFVKIRIEGYRAFAMSRYGGTSHYDIWPEGAARYWGEKWVIREQ